MLNCNGLTKSLGCRVALLLEGVFQRTPPMSAAAVAALLPEWLAVIFDGENADGGRHRLSAAAKGFVPGFVAEPEGSQCIPDSIMNHDFDFFTQHHRRIRFYKNNEPSVIGGPWMDLYQTETEALKQDQVLARPTDLYDFETPSLVCCNGAYFKGGRALLRWKRA